MDTYIKAFSEWLVSKGIRYSGKVRRSSGFQQKIELLSQAFQAGCEYQDRLSREDGTKP